MILKVEGQTFCFNFTCLNLYEGKDLGFYKTSWMAIPKMLKLNNASANIQGMLNTWVAHLRWNIILVSALVERVLPSLSNEHDTPENGAGRILFFSRMYSFHDLTALKQTPTATPRTQAAPWLPCTVIPQLGINNLNSCLPIRFALQ